MIKGPTTVNIKIYLHSFKMAIIYSKSYTQLFIYFIVKNTSYYELLGDFRGKRT